MRTGIDVLRKVLGFSLLVLASMAQAQGKEANLAFEISDVIVQAGETYRGSIHVPTGNDEIESKIPITVHTDQSMHQFLLCSIWRDRSTQLI